MIRQDFVSGFEGLGKLVRAPVEIVIAGGAALIVLGIVDRSTGDTDAIESSPKLSTLANEIAAVAEDLDLPPDWLNDGIRAYRDLLPADFRNRLVEVGHFGMLTVRALGRIDLILMKLAAGRARDLEDLQAIVPTETEISFVEGELARIHQIRPGDALRMRLYLEQHERGSDHGA